MPLFKVPVGTRADFSLVSGTGNGVIYCVMMIMNVNYTGIVDLADLSALVSYLTGGGYILPCPDAANPVVFELTRIYED